MKDQNKTKSQLIAELTDLRKQLSLTKYKSKAEQEKDPSQQIHFDVMDNIADGVTFCDTDGKITYMNEAGLNQIGYKLDEVLGQTPIDLFLEEKEISKFSKDLKALFAGKIITIEEYQAHRKSGQRFAASVSLSPQFDNNGKVSSLVAIHRDISKSKKIENSLKENEQRYRALFENSPIPLWEEDFSLVKKNIDLLKQKNISDFRKYFDENPQSIVEFVKQVKIIELNKAVVELHGAKSKREILQGLASLFTDESLKAFKEELIAIAEGRSECEFEGIVKTLTGEEKQINLKWVVVPGFERTLERVYISTVDIPSKSFQNRKSGMLSKWFLMQRRQLTRGVGVGT